MHLHLVITLNSPESISSQMIQTLKINKYIRKQTNVQVNVFATKKSIKLQQRTIGDTLYIREYHWLIFVHSNEKASYKKVYKKVLPEF